MREHELTAMNVENILLVITFDNSTPETGEIA